MFYKKEELPYNWDKAIEVVTRKIDKKLIKSRQAGFGKTLDYIEGHTVINLLNEAFGYCWSFSIVDECIYQTSPTTDKRGNVKGGDGYIVRVKGRLDVPGIGIKEQYGLKLLTGGNDVQEPAFKAAATDALKKCATLLGIGIELYMDDEQPQSRSASDVEHLKQKTQPATAEEEPLKKEFVESLKTLKAQLGITDNEDLNKYVSEATGGKLKSYVDIRNSNAKAIINLMKKDVAEQGH